MGKTLMTMAQILQSGSELTISSHDFSGGAMHELAAAARESQTRLTISGQNCTLALMLELAVAGGGYVAFEWIKEDRSERHR